MKKQVYLGSFVLILGVILGIYSCTQAFKYRPILAEISNHNIINSDPCIVILNLTTTNCGNISISRTFSDIPNCDDAVNKFINETHEVEVYCNLKDHTLEEKSNTLEISMFYVGSVFGFGPLLGAIVCFPLLMKFSYKESILNSMKMFMVLIWPGVTALIAAQFCGVPFSTIIALRIIGSIMIIAGVLIIVILSLSFSSKEELDERRSLK